MASVVCGALGVLHCGSLGAVFRSARLAFRVRRAARQNLLRDGAPDGAISVTGNAVIGGLLMEVAEQRQPAIEQQIDSRPSALLGKGWQAPALRASDPPPP